MKKNVIVSLADANYYPLLDELIDSGFISEFVPYGKSRKDFHIKVSSLVPKKF